MIYLKVLVKDCSEYCKYIRENAINDILTDPSVLENVPSLAKSKQNRLQNKLVQIKSQKNNDSLT